MNNMFNGCESLENKPKLDISEYLIQTKDMYKGCITIEKNDLENEKNILKKNFENINELPNLNF